MSSTSNVHPFGAVRREAIPIVGQPFESKQIIFQHVMVCKCSAEPQILVVIWAAGQEGVSGPCPKCGKRYAHKLDAQLNIGVLAPEPAVTKE